MFVCVSDDDDDDDGVCASVRVRPCLRESRWGDNKHQAQQKQELEKILRCCPATPAAHNNRPPKGTQSLTSPQVTPQRGMVLTACALDVVVPSVVAALNALRFEATLGELPIAARGASGIGLLGAIASQALCKRRGERQGSVAWLEASGGLEVGGFHWGLGLAS